MPNSPTFPTSGLSSGVSSGSLANWYGLNSIANGIYKAIIGTTRTTAFTIAQSNSGEFVPVNVAASVAVSVPQLEVGTSVELWARGEGKFTLTASGVTLSPPAGTTLPITPRVQFSSLTLLWVTPTLVYVSGDLL